MRYSHGDFSGRMEMVRPKKTFDFSEVGVRSHLLSDRNSINGRRFVVLRGAHECMGVGGAQIWRPYRQVADWRTEVYECEDTAI